MRNVLLIFVFSVNFIFSQLNAQSIDGWYGVGCDFDLPKKFKVGLNVESRSNFDYVHTIYQFFPEVKVSYKINKRLDVSSSYRHLMAREENTSFYLRNKLFFNLSTDFPINRMTVKNRARYQYQKRHYIDKEEDIIPDHYFRDKIEISYNIRKNPIDPFLAFEIFYPLNQYKINTIDEYRFVGGIDFPLFDEHSMECGVMYNIERFPVKEKAIVLLLNFGFSFK